MRFLIAFLMLDSKGGVIFLLLCCGALLAASLLATPAHLSSVTFFSVIVGLLLVKRLRNF